MMKIIENGRCLMVYSQSCKLEIILMTHLTKPFKSVVCSVVFCRVYTMIRMRDVPYLDHERGGASYKKILLVSPL